MQETQKASKGYLIICPTEGQPYGYVMTSTRPCACGSEAKRQGERSTGYGRMPIPRPTISNMMGSMPTANQPMPMTI